jgi:thiol-disulfide isomerase/thioredoxin
MESIKSIEEIKIMIKENPIALLYFGDESCGVCRVLLPKVEAMLKDYPDIRSGHIRIDMLPQVASEYSIFTIPAILLYIEGTEVMREARHISIVELQSKIARYLELYL